MDSTKTRKRCRTCDHYARHECGDGGPRSYGTCLWPDTAIQPGQTAGRATHGNSRGCDHWRDDDRESLDVRPAPEVFILPLSRAQAIYLRDKMLWSAEADPEHRVHCSAVYRMLNEALRPDNDRS